MERDVQPFLGLAWWNHRCRGGIRKREEATPVILNFRFGIEFLKNQSIYQMVDSNSGV